LPGVKAGVAVDTCVARPNFNHKQVKEK
jgi:hypothetical protein